MNEEKEYLLNEMEEVKKEIKEVTKKMKKADKKAALALEKNDVDTFEDYSKECVTLRKRIMALCSYLNVLTNRYTKLIVEGYNK